VYLKHVSESTNGLLCFRYTLFAFLVSLCGVLYFCQYDREQFASVLSINAFPNANISTYRHVYCIMRYACALVVMSFVE